MKLINKVENLVFAAVSRLDPRKYVRTHYAVQLRANWIDATFRYSVFGSYGEAISNYLKTQTSHYTFIDIGANQGLFTLIASESQQCIHIHSFEPNPKTFLLLEENISRLATSIKKKDFSSQTSYWGPRFKRETHIDIQPFTYWASYFGADSPRAHGG